MARAHLINTLGEGLHGTAEPTPRERSAQLSLGVERRGSAYRGGPIEYRAQTVSRCQDGKYRVGTNRAYRELRLKIACQEVYWSLGGARDAEREGDALYKKLGGDVEPDWDQRDRVELWLVAAQK